MVDANSATQVVLFRDEAKRPLQTEGRFDFPCGCDRLLESLIKTKERVDPTPYDLSGWIRVLKLESHQRTLLPAHGTLDADGGLLRQSE